MLRSIVEKGGLLPVWKPVGWTSADVVARWKSIVGRELRSGMNKKERTIIKVGHGGTLDRAAEGVLGLLMSIRTLSLKRSESMLSVGILKLHKTAVELAKQRGERLSNHGASWIRDRHIRRVCERVVWRLEHESNAESKGRKADEQFGELEDSYTCGSRKRAWQIQRDDRTDTTHVIASNPQQCAMTLTWKNVRYSAKHFDGKRMYDLARSGNEVTR